MLSFEIARIAARDFFVFLLRQLVFAHIETADRDRVLRFITAAPRFGLGAAHLEGAALNPNKALGYLHIVSLQRMACGRSGRIGAGILCRTAGRQRE